MITHHHVASEKPRRVTLIGASGFIGKAIKRELDARGVPSLPLTSSDVDLTQSGAADALAARLRPDDAVVMLAAITPDKGRDIASMMKNFAMMASVCAAVTAAGCAHFVYFSSDAVYPSDASRVTEETPASPRELYGAMHYTRERMAQSLANVPVLLLRPTLVYGPGDTHNAYGPNRFRRAAQKDGRIVLFGQGEERRDHIHVDDVAAVTIRCLLHRSTGTLNVATGVSHSFRDVAIFVSREFKPPAELVTTPRSNPVTHRHYDITNAIKPFPDMRFVALAEGIRIVHRQMVEKS